MMKKIYVLLAVAVMVCMSSMVFAAEVSVGGSVGVRSRNFNTMTFDKDNKSNTVDTQQRIIIDINAKAGDVKGKISMWNDWEDWGRLETNQGNGFGSSTSPGVVSGATSTTQTAAGKFGFREAWVSFDLPGLPVNVTGGHQLLQLGNGWFLQNKHFGSDAWVVANVTGPNTLAFVNIKVAEANAVNFANAGPASDDADAYAVLDVFKLNDDMTVGFDISAVKVRPTVELQNYSANFNGKVGPLKLMAQADFQTGKRTGGATQPKFKGNEIVVQGNVLMDPVTINFLLARGSGNKAGYVAATDDNKAFVNFLDINPRYTFLYEYKLATAAGARNTGFSNTTAISGGAMFAATNSLKVGLDVYFLQATEKIASPYALATANGETSSDVGIEVDGKVNWKLSDNLSWNWDLGYFKPGKAFKTAAGKTDAAMGIQGILAFKF